MAARIESCFLALAILSIPALSVAEDSEDGDSSPFRRSGPYVSLAGVYVTDAFEDAFENIIDSAFDVPIGVGLEDSGGLDARLGYRLASWFAAEVQYEWVDRFDVDLSVSGVPVGHASMNGHTLTANAKLIAPIWRIQPFLLIGIGGSVFEFEDHTAGNLFGGSGTNLSFAGRAGIGIDFHLTESIVLNTEGAVLATTSDFGAPDVFDMDDLYYVSVSAGLQYRF
jgi:opacity protein-like surface antigen